MLRSFPAAHSPLRRETPSAYACEVRAEGVVYGTRTVAHVLLGTFRTISPVLALRWLRGEALRIADGLDPDPATAAWFPRPRSGAQEAVPLADAPTELRAWATGPAVWRAAREHIKGGRPLVVTARDADCFFTLSIWPTR